MLTVYKWIEGTGLVKSDNELLPNTWINLAEPTVGEFENIRKVFTFPQEFLTDPLDKDERARVEFDEDSSSTLIVVRIPCKEPENENGVPYSTVPFGIIITQNVVITLCSQSTALIDKFLQMRRAVPPRNRYRFVFSILLRVATLYLRHLREIREEAEKIERSLHTRQSLNNDSLFEIRDLQKALVYFTTSLSANEIMVSRLRHMRQLGINDDDLDILDDVAVEYRQALEMATIHSNILTGTMESFASVISNNLNRVMKSLTAITIVFMLPTLVSSIYGMNVDLPLKENPHAFAIVIGIALALSMLTVFIFYRRKLF